MKPIPKKLPILELIHRGDHSVTFFSIVAGTKIITGVADFGIKKVGNQPAFIVHFLEQTTKGKSAKTTRQLEGWKDAAMGHLEKIARERGCKLMLFSTAEEHSRSNNTDRPLHVELLETYGRLPMRHGFKLRSILPKNGEDAAPNLWWRKTVTALDAYLQPKRLL